ncbi:MAG: right-handed parallel beta-helix repeat-containing protein [Candidatus Bathyarchaeota archaeon]|nr:MAG: right-handed parallel beta-helix repeat-containing protein [Candidatus Bathyarchaeota archaeon]
MKMKKIILLAFVSVLFSTAVFVEFIRPVEASGTIYISSDYTFTSNIYEPIVVTADNIIIDGAGYTVQGTGSGTGIDLSDRSNVTLKNVEVTNFTTGILLFYSSNNTLAGNTVSSNNEYGIHLFFSSNNVLTGNTVSSNNEYGILLIRSSNNVLTGNNASNNQYNFGVDGWFFSDFNNYVDTSNTVDGKPIYYLIGVADAVYDAETNAGTIYLINSNNITIKDLTLTKNYFGALFFNTTNSKIENITASNNYIGIFLFYSSNNTITGNTASSNGFRGISLYSSSNNVFFHNNLISNTVQASAHPTGDVNTWDDGYPSGGNYWSDYNGTDLFSGPYQNETGSDGIGDTAHVINANNTDNYPLNGMFSDFNATSEYHVQTICNSTISDFQYNGTAISFNVTGETDTIGFCGICIPTALMNVTYKVYVNVTEVSYDLLPCSNSTHSYLYFTYNLSTQEVIVIPEFPTGTSMLLILILLSIAIAIYKRRLLKTPTH